MDVSQFIHLPVKGHLDCVQFWVITNRGGYEHLCIGFV